MRVIFLVALGTLCAWGSPDVSAQAADPIWTKVEGGPGTGCSHDSTFAFFVHAGNPRRVMLYFDGGGGCWNGSTCDLKGKPTYTPVLDPARTEGGATGILELQNPANPVRDYSIVVVPYCTADVHLGSREVSYRDSLPDDRAPRTFVIRHHGASNVASAVGWIRAHWKAPELVFVTGGSAGAIPSPVYASELARIYPSARIVQLGDGAGGYRAPAVPGLLANWGVVERLHREAAYRGIDSSRFSFEALYVAAAKASPRVRFTQFNNASDEVQVAFLNLLGLENPVLPPLLRDNLAEVQRQNPAFRSYTAPGTSHTILTRPEFYAMRVDGVALRDWVAALLEGRAVADVGASLLH